MWTSSNCNCAAIRMSRRRGRCARPRRPASRPATKMRWRNITGGWAKDNRQRTIAGDSVREIRVTGARVLDVRFPTSLAHIGSDAVNRDAAIKPESLAAYRFADGSAWRELA